MRLVARMTRSSRPTSRFVTNFALDEPGSAQQHPLAKICPRSPTVQRKFDEKYGPTWHCIVGEDFKAAISHESKTFVFIDMGKGNVLFPRSG